FTRCQARGRLTARRARGVWGIRGTVSMLNRKKEKPAQAGERRLVPGITPRSLMASLLCMLLAGMYTQYSMVYIAENNQGPEQVLPVPAMAVLLLLVLVGGGLFALFRTRMLTRA